MLVVLALGALAGTVMASPACAQGVPEPTAPSLQQTLQQPGGGQNNDEFGQSVAVQGDTLVVGVPGAGPPSGAPGVVYVFARSGNSFHQTGMLTASNGAAGDRFGASVAIDGDVIVAGAPGADRQNGGADQGTVYTFARTGSADRSEIKELDSPVAAGSHLGASVAIDGNEIVAGAPDDGSGIIPTYETDCAAPCTPTHYLVNSDHGTNDGLGTSVAVAGDVIVAGAPHALNGTGLGAVYTFDRLAINGFQAENAKLVGSSDFGELGRSVATDGNDIVAGAPFSPGGGAALLFPTSGPNPRAPTATLTPKDGGIDFGSSVGIDGDTIVVSDDRGRSDAGVTSGAVYEFARYDSTSRHELSAFRTKKPPSFAELGVSVAISGDTILAGAPTQSNAFNSIGFATAFFADRVPPRTIGLRVPKKIRQGKTTKFRFRSSEKDSKFICTFDNGISFRCRSPLKVKATDLKRGRHTFSVYATDPAGNTDRTPAKAKFRVTRPKR